MAPPKISVVTLQEMRRSDHGRTRDNNRSPMQHQLRRDDDTNYDDVTMDMSEESYAGNESPRNDASHRPSPPRAHDPYQYGGGKSPGREDHHRPDRERRDYREERRRSPPSNHAYGDHNSGPPRRGLLGDRPGDPTGLGSGAGINTDKRYGARPERDSRGGGFGSSERDLRGGLASDRDSRGGGLGSDSRGGGLGSERDSRGAGLGSERDSRGGLGSDRDSRGSGLGSDSRGGGLGSERDSRGGGLGSERDSRAGGLGSERDSRAGGLGSERDSRGGGLGSERDSRGGGLGSDSRSGGNDRDARGGGGLGSGVGSDRDSRRGGSRGGPSAGLGQEQGQAKPPSLMDLKPFGGGPPPSMLNLNQEDKNGQKDARDARTDKDSSERDKRSDRERDRYGDRHGDREKDRERERSDRDKDRHGERDKRHEDKRSSNSDKRRERSRSRDKSASSSHRRRSPSGERDRRNYPSRSGDSRRSSSNDRKIYKRSHSQDRSPPAEYKPSYKMSKKLQAMEKMGLQIKTPDGTMATAQMLMQRTLDEQVEKVKNATGIELPKYYNPAAMHPMRYAEQIQKRKLLWGNKAKEATSSPVECTNPKPDSVSKWQGAKFAQDNDGKVASKFLRLMGVKDPNPVKQAPVEQPGDIVKKQEEMFEAMQAQYDVARATTHTMRGVGLGFSSMHRNF